MVTLARGMVPEVPRSRSPRETDRCSTGFEPASTTTWNDSNSFRAARMVASAEPAGWSVGRTVVTGPTTTTLGPSADAWPGDEELRAADPAGNATASTATARPAASGSRLIRTTQYRPWAVGSSALGGIGFGISPRDVEPRVVQQVDHGRGVPHGRPAGVVV